MHAPVGAPHRRNSSRERSRVGFSGDDASDETCPQARPRPLPPLPTGRRGESNGTTRAEDFVMGGPGVDAIHLLTLFFLSLRMHKHTGQPSEEAGRCPEYQSSALLPTQRGHPSTYTNTQTTNTGVTDGKVRCDRRTGKRRARWEGRLDVDLNCWLCGGLCLC